MNTQLFKRNLARCGKMVKLQNRDIEAPRFDSADFDELFSEIKEVPAIIKTPRGRIVFDGVDTETQVTHEICIAYVAGVTSETWIEFKGRRFDILNVQNCCEEDAVLILDCAEKGVNEASKA